MKRVSNGGRARDAEQRRRRTERDWSRGLPDQYPGPTRALIRAFLDSGDEQRLVTGVTDAASFNSSIQTLGLADEAYAEQRGNEVWVRRTPEEARALG